MKMFSDMGVPTKETPFEVAEASDVVITMLPSSSHVSIMIQFADLKHTYVHTQFFSVLAGLDGYSSKNIASLLVTTCIFL